MLTNEATPVATPNDDPEGPEIEGDTDIPTPSMESEPVSNEGNRQTASSPDLIISSDDSENVTDEDEPGSNSSAGSNLTPLPKADAFLNVSTDPGSSQNTSSTTTTTTTGPQPVNGEAVDVDLSVIDPSAEELLEFDPEVPSPENHRGSTISIEISAEALPEPSKTPDPLEDVGAMSVPRDIDDVVFTPDVDFPDISYDPSTAESFESPDIALATPQVASATPDISADESFAKEESESSVSTTEASQAEPSTEPKILVDFPLSFSSSRVSLGPEFDMHSREFLGETTNTTADQWKPTAVSGTIRAIQRQQGSRWEITYQGELKESAAQRSVETLEKNINEGAMDGFLTERLSTSVTVRTASPPSLNAAPREEVAVTGAAPKETASGNATTDVEQEEVGDEKNLGVILGTCFGLLGALILGATVFEVVRRSSRNDESHVLDGVATAPTTMLSFESDQTETESRFHTGAPTKPRGPSVLRNQSRILDWQLDHATATGKAKHVLGRESTGKDITEVDSTSEEGDISSAEVLV